MNTRQYIFAFIARWLVERKAFFISLRWVAPLITAVLLANVSWLESIWFPLADLPKGSVAAYTIRATHDAVFDLHETFQAEAEEAKRSYPPIYNRDEMLPFDRQEKILNAALAEPLSAWRFPLAPELSSGDGGPARDDAKSKTRSAAAPRRDEEQRVLSDSGVADEESAQSAEETEEEKMIGERRREIEAVMFNTTLGANSGWAS